MTDGELGLAVEVALERLGGDELDSYAEEKRKVLLWRAFQFCGLGFDAETSVALAESRADLDRARRLARARCPHETAARILL